MELSKSKANTKAKEANPEIGTRFLFQNFTYKFGGNTYLHMSGGPIGARFTMAGSRQVMHSWARQYSGVLLRSGLRLPMEDMLMTGARDPPLYGKAQSMIRKR